jgi:uncharacterized protein
VHIAPLDSSFYYAFNFDEPSGVKLLRGALAERLLILKQNPKPVPEIDTYFTGLDRVLAAHKLLLVKSDPQAYYSRPPSAKKSFNVWLHVINGCNLKCFYCYIPQLESHINPAVINSNSLSNETAHCIIERLLAFCRTNGFTHLRIKFAGGEPTLNMPVVEQFCHSITEAAGDLHVSFGMISNGTFSIDDVQPLLTRHNISLSISVDGFESYHDRVRFSVSDGQRMGTWSTIERNITALMNFGIMPYLLYTVTKLNAASLHKFAEWAHSRKLGFRLSPVRLRRASLGPEIDEISSHISSLYSWLGASMPTSLMFERDARFAEWNLKKKKLSACGSCRNYLALTETGEIRPCQMSPSSPFNILGHTIDEALNGFRSHPHTATLADPSLKIGACKRCEYYHVCSGGCPQHTLSVQGVTDTPSPWCRLFGETAHPYIKAKALHLRRQLALIEERNCQSPVLS